MLSFAAFRNQQQTPLHLKGSGLFRKYPEDDPIRFAMTDFDLENSSYIAKGSFGKVHKTRFRDGLDVAQKTCFFKERRVQDFEHEQDISLESWYRELSFHRSSKHEHIVRLHGFIAISADIISFVPLPDGTLRPPDLNRPKALHLFLELMTCSFREILNCLLDKCFDCSETPFKCEGTVQVEPFRAFLKHVCSGLIYLHDNGYMHRDLKPGNILLKVEEGRAVAKLADFGTIKVNYGLNLLNSLEFYYNNWASYSNSKLNRTSAKIIYTVITVKVTFKRLHLMLTSMPKYNINILCKYDSYYFLHKNLNKT